MGLKWLVLGLIIIGLILNALYLHLTLGYLLVFLIFLCFLGYAAFIALMGGYFILAFIYSLLRSYIFNFAVAVMLGIAMLLDPKLLPNAIGLGAIAAFSALGGFEVWWERYTIRKFRKMWEEREREYEKRRRYRERRGTARRTGSKAAKWYAILGVPKTATMEEVKQAYRRLALRYHPDVNKSKDAETRMKEINEAYEKLETALEKPARASRP